MIGKKLALLIGMAIVLSAFSMPAAVFGQRAVPGNEGKTGKVDKETKPVERQKGAESAAKAEDGKPKTHGKAEGTREEREERGAAGGPDERGKHPVVGKEGREERGMAGGPDERGKGPAIGKDKKKKEGSGLGKDRENGPESARQGGKNAPLKDKAAMEARRAEHKKMIQEKRDALLKNGTHQERFKAGMDRKGKAADEQRKHLKRMAHLKRMMELASEQQKANLVTKLGVLKDKELERHRLAMEKFQATGGGAGK